MIALEIIYAILMVFASYFMVHMYLTKTDERYFGQKIVTISRGRIIFLIIAAITEGLALAFTKWFYPDNHSLHIIATATMLAILLSASAVDYRYKIIPNQFVLTGFVAAVLFLILAFVCFGNESGLSNLKNNLVGALVMGLFFFLLSVVFKQSLGMGDVKIIALIGLFEGLWGVVTAVFYSLIVSFFIALFYLLTRKKGKHDTMAFGPSILAGTLLAICLSGI